MRFQPNLLSRLILLGLLVLVPVVAAQIINEAVSFQTRLADIHNRAVRSADVYNTELEQIVRGIGQVLQAVAALPDVQSRAPLLCDKALRQVAAGYRSEFDLVVADAGGDVVCSSNRPSSAGSIGVLPLFPPEVDFATGNFTVDPLDRQPALRFATPLKSGAGARAGVVVAYLRLDWLEKTLARPALDAGESLTVTDRNGRVLAALPGPAPRPGDELPAQYLATMHRAGPGSMQLADAANHPTIYGYVPITLPPEGLYLLFGIDRQTAVSAINAEIRRTVILTLISVAGAVTIAWLVGVRWVRGPIYALVRSLEAWHGGHWPKNRAPPATGVPEFQYLNAAFKRMAADVDRHQRQLAAALRFKDMILAAAGHDLRQPLQTIVFAVQKLAKRAIDGTELRAAESANRAVQRLSGDLDLLVNMARVRDRTLTPNREPFIADILLADVATRWTERAKDKGIRICVRPSGLALMSDRNVLAIAINNLVANAIKYTRRGGVLIACRRRAQTAWIEIYDTGIGIAADDLEGIFHEFRQIDPAADGFGLGLWIAKSAADCLGHPITVRSQPGRGSRFRIEVPVHEAARGVATPAAADRLAS